MKRVFKRSWSALILWTALVVVLAAGAAFILGHARSSPKDDFWSTAVPGVLTGLGTLALSVATVALAYQDRRRDDRLRTDERSHNESERGLAARRQQASQVSGWLGAWSYEYQVIGIDPFNPTAPLVKTQTGKQSGAIIRNLSGLPIWGVRAFWHIDGADKPTGDDRQTVDVVPPGEDGHVSGLDLDIESDRFGALSVSFRDAAGLTWTRDRTGRLVEGLLEYYELEDVNGQDDEAMRGWQQEPTGESGGD